MCSCQIGPGFHAFESSIQTREVTQIAEGNLRRTFCLGYIGLFCLLYEAAHMRTTANKLRYYQTCEAPVRTDGKNQRLCHTYLNIFFASGPSAARRIRNLSNFDAKALRPVFNDISVTLVSPQSSVTPLSKRLMPMTS